jgi:hypothetical protein
MEFPAGGKLGVEFVKSFPAGRKLPRTSLDNIAGLVIAYEGKKGVPAMRYRQTKNPGSCHDVYENTSR